MHSIDIIKAMPLNNKYLSPISSKFLNISRNLLSGNSRFGKSLGKKDNSLLLGYGAKYVDNAILIPQGGTFSCREGLVNSLAHADEFEVSFIRVQYDYPFKNPKNITKFLRDEEFGWTNGSEKLVYAANTSISRNGRNSKNRATILFPVNSYWNLRMHLSHNSLASAIVGIFTNKRSQDYIDGAVLEQSSKILPLVRKELLSYYNDESDKYYFEFGEPEGLPTCWNNFEHYLCLALCFANALYDDYYEMGEEGESRFVDGPISFCSTLKADRILRIAEWGGTRTRGLSGLSEYIGENDNEFMQVFHKSFPKGLVQWKKKPVAKKRFLSK